MEERVDESIFHFDQLLNVSGRGNEHRGRIDLLEQTRLSSLDMISNRTSCRVRSREPMLDTRSSSVTSLQDCAARMRLPLVVLDMEE